MSLSMYFPDGSVQEFDLNDPNVFDRPFLTSRPAAIVIRMDSEYRMTEGHFLLVEAAETLVSEGGFVGMERV